MIVRWFCCGFVFCFGGLCAHSELKGHLKTTKGLPRLRGLWSSFKLQTLLLSASCYGIIRWIRNFHAAFAIRLTSTHSCKDDYVLEFVLPGGMKETSERVLLINKVLRTLQRKCLKMWEVWVRELNEASGSEVRLDDERTSSIPHEAVSRVFHFHHAMVF
uniref:NLP1-9 GAF domain-containing protein n=1 Tax=Populus trichocarpa TaxID=3694 RepID=A0A3N7G208_POPTR